MYTPSDRIDTTSCSPVSCFFSWCSVSGSSIFTPRWSIGVMTMKMMRSTSTTSTSGVMLISAFAVPVAILSSRRWWILWRVLCFAIGLLPVPALAQDVADQLRGDVVHVDHELLDGVGEVVERHDGRDGDDEADRGGEERFGDTRRDRPETA